MRTEIVILLLLSLCSFGYGADEPEVASVERDLFDLSLDELLDMRVYVDVASRFLESDLQAGSTVSLIRYEDWERRGARNLEDAANHIPATVFLPSSFGGQQLSIRGYAGRQLHGTSVLLDNVPINSLDHGTATFEINSLQLGALDRIEMVRGPGSAIYGADAFHGVLALHTHASEKDTIGVGVEAGADDYSRTSIRLSQSLTESVRLHMALGYTHQGDENIRYRYTDPDTGSPAVDYWGNRTEALMGVIKLETEPTRPLSARVGVYFNESRAMDFPGYGPINPTIPDISGSDNQFAMVNGAVVQQLPNGIELEINGFYWEAQRLRQFDSAITGMLDIENDTSRLGANVQLKQENNAWNTQWLLGAGYDEADIGEHTSTRYAAGLPLPTTIGAQQGQDRESYNALAQARTRIIGDTVHVLYGGRLDDYSDFGVQFSPRAGLIYTPAAGSALKFLYGNAFRPATGAHIAGTPNVPGTPDLEPETIDTYELVAMRQTETWKAQAILFYSDWQDAIVGARPNPPRNIGENHAYGAELSFSVIKGNARLDFNGSYVESKDEVNDIDYAAFPSFILNPGFGIAIPSCNLELYLINRIQLDRHEGSTDDPEPSKLEDYWRTDLNITWMHPNHNLELFVNLLNLFDRSNTTPSLQNVGGGIGDIAFSPSAGVRACW